MVCPKCRSRATGRIGQNQYYCWDCNIEFIPTKDGFRMYRLEPDGTTILDSLDSAAQDFVLTGTADAGPKLVSGPEQPPQGTYR